MTCTRPLAWIGLTRPPSWRYSRRRRTTPSVDEAPRHRPGRAGPIADGSRHHGRPSGMRPARPTDRDRDLGEPGRPGTSTRPARRVEADRYAGHGTSCTALRSRPSSSRPRSDWPGPSTAGAAGCRRRGPPPARPDDGRGPSRSSKRRCPTPAPTKDAILGLLRQAYEPPRTRPRPPAGPARPRRTARTSRSSTRKPPPGPAGRPSPPRRRRPTARRRSPTAPEPRPPSPGPRPRPAPPAPAARPAADPGRARPPSPTAAAPLPLPARGPAPRTLAGGRRGLRGRTMPRPGGSTPRWPARSGCPPSAATTGPIAGRSRWSAGSTPAPDRGRVGEHRPRDRPDPRPEPEKLARRIPPQPGRRAPGRPARSRSRQDRRPGLVPEEPAAVDRPVRPGLEPARRPAPSPAVAPRRRREPAAADRDRPPSAGGRCSTRPTSGSTTPTPRSPRRSPRPPRPPAATRPSGGPGRRPGTLAAPVRGLPLPDGPAVRPDDRPARGFARLLDDGDERRPDHLPTDQPPGRPPDPGPGRPAPRGHPRHPRRPLHRAADPPLGRRGDRRPLRARRRAGPTRRRPRRAARGQALPGRDPDEHGLPRRPLLGPVLRPERLADPVPGRAGHPRPDRPVPPGVAAERVRAGAEAGLQDRRLRRPPGRWLAYARETASPDRAAAATAADGRTGPSRRSADRPLRSADRLEGRSRRPDPARPDRPRSAHRDRPRHAGGAGSAEPATRRGRPGRDRAEPARPSAGHRRRGPAGAARGSMAEAAGRSPTIDQVRRRPTGRDRGGRPGPGRRCLGPRRPGDRPGEARRTSAAWRSRAERRPDQAESRSTASATSPAARPGPAAGPPSRRPARAAPGSSPGVGQDRADQPIEPGRRRGEAWPGRGRRAGGQGAGRRPAGRLATPRG